jgi:hypothetical protein
LQASPEVQHGCVALPHAVAVWQVPDWQVPSEQVLPPQHAWPRAPHAWQVPDWQTPEVHVVPPQHASPMPPHERQVPDWQLADPRHAVPLVQHAWFRLPQLAAVWQVPLVHEPWLHTLPAQHGWLSPPQATQLFDWQVFPAWQAEPLVQQAWPVAPQLAPPVRQVPLVHVKPDSHEVPPQQVKPSLPQQKPRASQVGAVPQVVFETQPGRHTGTPEVPALVSQT